MGPPNHLAQKANIVSGELIKLMLQNVVSLNRKQSIDLLVRNKDNYSHQAKVSSNFT